MSDQDYTQATAEELAKTKTQGRIKRVLQFGKDRRNNNKDVRDGKYSHPLRTYQSNADDLVGINLRRVTKLSDVESS